MKTRFLSVILSLALVVGMFSGGILSASATAKDNEEMLSSGQVFDSGAGRILHYSFKFDNQNSTEIPDDSDHGKTGELINYNNSGASIVDDTIYGKDVKALSLKGGSSGGYLQMPEGVLGDAADVTISCWVKVESNGGYQRIWDFGNNTTSYMYLLTDGANAGAVGYATAITNGGWSKEQTVQMGSTLNKDQWIFTTVVLDSTNHTLSLYKDGALIGRNTNVTVPLSALGTTKKNYIGYGQFGDAPIGGEFTDFSVYNYAMTDEQVSDMCEIPDEDKVAADKDALDLGDLSQVMNNLTLPTKGAYGSLISWDSSDPDVIATDGTVVRPAAGSDNADVTLTATLTYGSESETKLFSATVISKPTDEQIAQADLEAINLGDINNVINNLILPVKGNLGSTITWESSNTSVILNDGKVIRPAAGSSEASLTLTATATYNSTSVTKDYPVTVLPKYYLPVIKIVPDLTVTTLVGVSPKFPDIIPVTYTNGTSDSVKVRWPDTIPAAQYASAGTFDVTGTIIDTTTTVKATVTVTDEDDIPTPDLEVIQSELSAVDLQGDTILTQNRQRDINYLLRLDADRMLYNFRKAFGQDTKGAEPLGGWDAPDGLLRGHSTGHYLSALALAYSSTSASTDPQVVAEHKALKDKMDLMVNELSKLQDLSKGDPSAFTTKCTPTDAAQAKWSTDPNVWGAGFLSAYSPDQFALLEQYTPYATIWAPYYTYHKIIAGMIDCYSYGGNETALKVAKGMGDWVYTRLSKCTTETQRNKMWDMYIAGEYGGMNESLAKLYMITTNQNYLDAAKMFDNKKFFDNLAKNVDDIRTRHANQHIPQIIGAMAEYAATGDKYYYNVASNFWDMVVARYTHSIGGVGTGEKFTQPYTQAASIQTNQNDETCAAYNMLKLTKALYSYDPDNAKYMDYYERTLLNQIVASQDQSQEDTNAVTYMLPIGPGQRKSYSNDYNSFTCCHGTGMENHVKYQEAAYYHTDDNSKLYVNLYMPTQLNWTEKGIVLKQETEFPSDHSVFTIQGDASFDLRLRVPYWATNGYSVEVNGETVISSATPSSYVSINREWKDGDKIEVNMPFGLHLDKTPDKLDGATVASVMYGPIVMVGKNSSKNWITLTLSPALMESIKVQDDSATKDGVTLTTNNLTLVPMYTAYNFAYHTYFKINIPADGSEPIDKSLLQSLYNSCKDMNQGNYTDASWRIFTDALNQAKSTLDNNDATQDDVNQVVSMLTSAKDGLTENPGQPADKSSLQALYEQYKGITKGDYTEASWNAFTAALGQAKSDLDDDSATQDEVNRAVFALASAKDGLTKNPVQPADKSSLQALYEQYKEFTKGNYTDTSWKIFTDALNQAKSALDNDSATQDDVNQAFAVLTSAKNGLITKSSGHHSSSSTSTPASPIPQQEQNFRSDTTETYHFNSNTVYYYKVITTDPIAPTATSSNPSAVTVEFAQKIADGYLFRISNVGVGEAVIITRASDGTTTSFTAHGTAVTGVTSDTPQRHSMSRGKTYQFKFTVPAAQGMPTFTTGNSQIVKPVLLQKIGDAYYFKVEAVANGSAGVYVTVAEHSAVRECIITVG